MYMEGYVSCVHLLEHQETAQDTRGVSSSAERWTYSTGRFKNGAVGLCNIGVTCCLNPLLQTLYMNRDFTDILCGIETPDTSVPPEGRLPHELLALFEEMQNRKEDAVPPYRILRCLQMLNVNLFVQYEAADLFLTLWSLLLKQMPQPHLAEKLRALYTVRLEEYVTCHKCYHERSSDKDVLTIPLPVSDSRHHRKQRLEHDLWTFFMPQELSGENKSFCPQCREKTASLKGTRLLSQPRTLTIHLKRISLRKSSRLQKINRTLSFPPSLDLSEVLDPEHLPEQQQAQGPYKYRLFAVVAHSGTASFGHYCAYINSSKDKKWYCFNDSSVCKVSWDDVKCTFGNTSFHWGVTACLLVYVRAEAE